MVVEEFLTSAVLIPWIETEMFFRTMHLWNTDSSAGEKNRVSYLASRKCETFIVTSFKCCHFVMSFVVSWHF